MLLLFVERNRLTFSRLPLLSVALLVSGLVVPETGGNETVPEVVTTSGYALLHFFSDAAYNLTGFTIAYSYVWMSALPHLLPVSGIFEYTDS